jgi:hypothetical protein
MTSGAMYSSVPTNEFVLKSAIQDLVSTNIVCPSAHFPDVRRNQLTPFGPPDLIVAGAPPGSPDCFDKSKSDNMICPD